MQYATKMQPFTVSLFVCPDTLAMGSDRTRYVHLAFSHLLPIVKPTCCIRAPKEKEKVVGDKFPGHVLVRQPYIVEQLVE